MTYTIEQFRAQPSLWLHDHGLEWARVLVPCEGGPAVREYAEVLFLSEGGAVCVGNYMWAPSWLSGPQSPDGLGIYTVPWDAIDALLSEADAEQSMAGEAADFQLLSYAR